MTKRGPDVCDYTFHTTAGPVTFRAWRYLSPAGADRLHNLARLGYYNSSPLHRVLPGFLAQWGVAHDPTLAAVYDSRNDVPGAILPHEIPHFEKGTNTKHWMAYGANASPSSSSSSSASTINRTSELFVSLVDNTKRLKGKGLAAFAYVVEGAEVVDGWHAGYGEMQGLCAEDDTTATMNFTSSGKAEFGAWACRGPNTATLHSLGGGAFIDANYPGMDRVAWVDVNEYDGAWGDRPGPGHQVLSWSLIVTVVFATIAGYLRFSIAMKAHRKWWSSRWKSVSTSGSSTDIAAAAAAAAAVDESVKAGGLGLGRATTMKRPGVLDIVTKKSEHRGRHVDGEFSKVDKVHKPYSSYYNLSAAAKAAAAVTKLSLRRSSSFSSKANSPPGSPTTGTRRKIEKDVDAAQDGAAAVDTEEPTEQRHGRGGGGGGEDADVVKSESSADVVDTIVEPDGTPTAEDVKEDADVEMGGT